MLSFVSFLTLTFTRLIVSHIIFVVFLRLRNVGGCLVLVGDVKLGKIVIDLLFGIFVGGHELVIADNGRFDGHIVEVVVVVTFHGGQDRHELIKLTLQRFNVIAQGHEVRAAAVAGRALFLACLLDAFDFLFKAIHLT